MHPRRARPTTVAGALVLALVGVLAIVTAKAGVAWINTTFPGFFVLRNRVVASISLPGWPASEQPEVFQATVVAVDGEPVHSSAEIYARAAATPPGTPHEYQFQRQGERFSRRIPSQLFTWRDGLLLFGAFLFNGLVFSAIGAGVWMLSPQRAAPWAILALGLCSSVFGLTGIELYGPHRFFRLHALAECFLPAALLHLALLFPVRRCRVGRAVAVSYLPSLALALVYQARLDDPARYPGVHELATFCIAVSGLYLVGSVVHAYLHASSDLIRQRVRVVALGLVVGLALPVLLVVSSAATNGQVPVNAMGFTAFLFPLSVAYAVYKRDLFAIDALVQRGIYYTTLSGLVTVAYLAIATGGTQVFHLSPLGRSPAFSLAFTLAAIFLLPTVRGRLQRFVDRLFGRQTYDVQEVLAEASTALGSTLNLGAILDLTLTLPVSVLRLEHAAVFLRAPGGFEEAARVPRSAPGVAHPAIAGGSPLPRLLGTVPLIVRGALPAQPARDRVTTVALLEALGAELVVPLACQGTLTGFIACGRKLAGTSFAATDASFLRTFANQAALSLQNACTFRDLRVLNAELEARVTERTHELAASKDRLAASLAQLESAYGTLQASQEQLVSAEKMAAFGRLAAGIAHEMNTPLGAALNGLQVARELIAEAEAMAGDASVTDQDRRSVAAELADLLANVEEWTRKAVAYIRSVKAHARTGGTAAPFELRPLLERGLQPLLMHRVRLAGGALEFRIAPDLPELHGDSGRLGQVLANLLTNAIDASEGLPPERHRIVVEATGDDREVVVSVRDRGAGIPSDVLEHVFDEFYTTKPLGKGTGLGLSIARDIVTAEFGGTLLCSASGPDGTTFTLRLPVPVHGDRCATHDRAAPRPCETTLERPASAAA